MTSAAQQRGGGSAWRAWLIALAATSAVLVLLRLALGTGALAITWDEKYAVPIIEAIRASDWSIASLLDYDDTKGPAFFWLYAAWGEVVGGEAVQLRWLSIIATALGAAAITGMLAPRERSVPGVLMIALLAVTLPYSAVLSQLVMSEATFVLGGVAMAVVAVRSLCRKGERMRRVVGPVCFGVLLAALLHHRVHVLALGGAVVVLALAVEGRRGWPWVVAALLAGLSRLPLYLRWGGLVGESFRERYSVGLRFDSLAYLLAALLPTIGLALVVMVMRRRQLGSAALGAMIAAGALGAALAVLAPPGVTSEVQDLRFAGPVASVLRPLATSPILLSVALAALAALGAMSLAGAMWLGWGESGSENGVATATPMQRCGTRLACLTILFGWLLSALASGDVYDRYLIAFTFLWPLWCVRVMPRRIVIAQIAWQAAFTGLQVWGQFAAR